MEWLNTAFDWIGKLPAEALLGVLLFGLGYVLKSVDLVNNKVIPLFIIIAGGPLYLFIDQVGVRKIVIGMVIGVVVWIAHKQGLSRIEDKIPWLKTLANPDEPPKPPAA